MKGFHEAAHRYIGVPFRHRGRTAAGLDCGGLVVIAARDCGYNGFVEYDYGKEPSEADMRESIESNMGTAIDDEPQVNDVVQMRFSETMPANHVAIITSHRHGLGVIHTSASFKKVIYHRLTDKMKKLIVSVYRW